MIAFVRSSCCRSGDDGGVSLRLDSDGDGDNCDGEDDDTIGDRPEITGVAVTVGDSCTEAVGELVTVRNIIGEVDSEEETKAEDECMASSHVDVVVVVVVVVAVIGTVDGDGNEFTVFICFRGLVIFNSVGLLLTSANRASSMATFFCRIVSWVLLSPSLASSANISHILLLNTSFWRAVSRFMGDRPLGGCGLMIEAGRRGCCCCGG